MTRRWMWAGLAAVTALAAGAYEWTTVQRLPVAGSGAILPDNRLRLTELTVTP